MTPFAHPKWDELVRHIFSDQLVLDLRRIFLSRDQSIPLTPQPNTSKWVHPVPFHPIPATKLKLYRRVWLTLEENLGAGEGLIFPLMLILIRKNLKFSTLNLALILIFFIEVYFLVFVSRSLKTHIKVFIHSYFSFTVRE